MTVKHRRKSMWLMSLATALAFSTVSFADTGEGDEGGSRQGSSPSIASPSNAEPDEKGGSKTETADSDRVRSGTFWIGIVCMPLENELVKTHLGVEHGMVITTVIEGGPADQAGLQENDILLEVGDEALTNLHVLAAAIEKAGDNQLTLKLLRAGKRQSVKVTPAARPDSVANQDLPADHEVSKEWKSLRKTLRRHGLVPEVDGDSFMFVMPGFILPDQKKDFPKDLEVTITKKGQEDAEITVKHGDKQWKIDAESLDELPENIRPHVRTMLGQPSQTSIRLEAEGTDWLDKLSENLLPPRILKKSLEIAPDGVHKLHRFDRKLRKRIGQQLRDANRALEKAEPGVSAAALEELKDELQELRTELKALRRQQTQTTREEAARDATTNDE